MLIAIDLSRQQKLDADPKAIQQFNFTGNLENAMIFFIIEEAKEAVLDFSKELVKVLWFSFRNWRNWKKNWTEVTLNLSQTWLEILTMKLIFNINYY